MGQRYVIVVIGMTSVLLFACSGGDPDSVPSTPGVENPTPLQTKPRSRLSIRQSVSPVPLDTVVFHSLLKESREQ
jgi:hypothetical protein